MAGARETEYFPLEYAPGVVTNLADRDATSRYKSSNRVRWHKGQAEKVGGWQRQTLTGANNGVYIGVARALHDWASLDTQQWIGIGTNCKLYLVNSGTLYDVTPLRKTSNLSNPLAVSIGSPTITITDPDHRVAEGDHVSILAAAAIGGFEVSGDYDVVTVIDPDTYTVTFSSNFNSTEAAGGGGVTISYDIGCGLAENGELYGYGTGPYGEGTYGTPREEGSGVQARMRTWSLDNWGEDLVGCPSDGEIYWWDRTLGPNSRAKLIANAPRGVQRILVNPENRHLLALGCTSATGEYDPMRIRWCAQEDLNDWTPNEDDTAGGRRLDHGSRIVTGVKSRSTNYVWTDTQLYSLTYSAPGDFIPNPLGACKIVGPNAGVDVNGRVFFMAFDDFMIFNGVLQVLPCEVHTKIFGDEDRNIEGDFDRTQAEAVFCSSYSAKNEVQWLYPKTDGTVGYVVFNYTPGAECWYFGTMPRTAYHDVSEAITGYKTNPYGVNGGYLYKHEVGTDEVEGATTTPQAWFLETYDNNIGGSDKVLLINALVPNFDRLSGSMRVTLYKKSRPRQPVYQPRGPYLIEEDTVEKGVRCKGSQFAIRWESNNETGEDFRFGKWQILATPYGKRAGIHRGTSPPPPLVLPEPPVLSGELADEDPTFSDLSWTEGVAGTHALGDYTLQRSVNSEEGPFTTLTTVTQGNPRVYEDEDVSVGNSYSYRVKVVDSEGNNSDPEWSNVVTLTPVAPPEPMEVIDISARLETFFSSNGSFTYDAPSAYGPDDNVVIVLFLSYRGTNSVDAPPTAVSYGNIPGTTQYMRGPPGGAQSGVINSFVAMIPLQGQTPDDNVVRFSWPNIGLEGDVGIIQLTAINVSEDSNAFALGFVELDDPLNNGPNSALPAQTPEVDDIIVSVGAHYTNNVSSIAYTGDGAAAYTMAQTSGTSQDFSVGHHVAGGHRVQTDTSEQVESDSDYRTGFAFILRQA